MPHGCRKNSKREEGLHQGPAGPLRMHMHCAAAAGRLPHCHTIMNGQRRGPQALVPQAGRHAALGAFLQRAAAGTSILIHMPGRNKQSRAVGCGQENKRWGAVTQRAEQYRARGLGLRWHRASHRDTAHDSQLPEGAQLALQRTYGSGGESPQGDQNAPRQQCSEGWGDSGAAATQGWLPLQGYVGASRGLMRGLMRHHQ